MRFFSDSVKGLSIKTVQSVDCNFNSLNPRKEPSSCSGEGSGFFLTTIIIYALFFMIEESTSISLKIICGLVGGAGLFIFFNL